MFSVSEMLIAHLKCFRFVAFYLKKKKPTQYKMHF